MAKKEIPRIATFDILRGYFLVGILIDHLAFFPNGLDWWSARGGLFVSMAEGFFLISGILLGIIRGAKAVDMPFQKVTKLLLGRGFRLYIISVILTFIFTALAWLFFMDTPGLKFDVAPAGTPIWQLVWETLTLQYFYGWAGYLRLYAVFIVLSPLFVWLLRKGRWYIGLLACVGIWLLFPDPLTTEGLDQERAQLLSWQLIFFMGMTIGFYWADLTEFWNKLSKKVQQGIFITMCATTAITLLTNVAIMMTTMGYDFSFIGIVPQMQHDLYVTFFDKEQLPLARILLFMLWFWTAFSLVRKFEKPIIRWMGWLLVTFGTNSLYVYTVNAFMIFFVHLYFVPGSLLFNMAISLACIFLTLLMIRYKVLMKIIPR